MRKKLTLGRVAAGLFAALFVFPLTVKAQDCQFTPSVFPGQVADRTEYEVNATVQVGEGAMATMQYGSLQNLQVSNSNPADIIKTPRSMGVFFVGAGTADVTYTEKVMIDRENFCTTDHTIHYTIAKGTPTAGFVMNGAAVTEYTASYSTGSDEAGGGGAEGTTIGGDGGAGGGGSSVRLPNYQLNIQSYNENSFRFVTQPVPSAEITFNSTNPSVASISATGQVTVNGLGETVISLSWPGNDNWEPASASYTLKVKKPLSFYFSPYVLTDTIEKVIKNEPIFLQGEGTITSWASTNEQIATVDNQGNVTLLQPGNVQIVATCAETEEYVGFSTRYAISVMKKKPHIHFSYATAELEWNVLPYEFPALVTPGDLTGSYSWFDYNSSAARVDDMGNVTILGVGTATIRCIYSGDNRYLPDTAMYSIHVTTSGIYVLGTYVTTANGGDIFGDGSVIYSPDVHSSTGYALELNNVHLDANGGVAIQSENFVAIRLNGNCSITNASKGIYSTTNGAVFIWSPNKKDTLQIEATQEAIFCGATKIHDCYLFANGGATAIRAFPYELGISAGGYVFAQANAGGEAIKTAHFLKGEGGIGGINVLTKGVTFVDGDGFLTDVSTKTKASFVEIGKIPLPVAENEVTDINFESENPYDNLDVVFSESEEDKFNEETKQIELSTTTTDDAVDGALELYVTCSSEWLKLLPGVLVFDVPAGSGELALQCELEEGYKLQVAIEGVGKVSITQTNNGWAVVQYEVLEQTHVIVYLQEETTPSPAPAKAQALKDGGPSVGASIKAIKITPGSVDKYYVFGSFNGWAANENYRLTLNQGAATTEYMMELPLTTTDQFKVVKVDGENKTWYPDLVPNYGANGEIQEDGNYTIYFRPNGDGGDDWFYHVIYVAKIMPSDIENVNTNGKAVKVLRDGQLLIKKNGKTYNIIGAELR